ncbi:hypothetical protein BGX21_001348 [Mortierella sp. AD011]|nr:hypothetical protein BGX20_003535 [Mortierella sp. AD010]KAF9401558.1 hypothetical protein BGX21_001348 [Mortierella sp. AD011]
MAEDNHEQTPLLQDQEDQDHHTSHERMGDQADIRNFIQNETPSGHHISFPKKIHAILPRLFGLINSLVESTDAGDDVVTDDVVEFIAGLGKEVVYGLLRCVETYLNEGERDVGRKRLLQRRADIAQLAAASVTRLFVGKDLMATYCHVLTRPFYAAGEDRDTAENAIEIAIRVHATDFLAEVEVQRCVQALWNGLILQTEDDESGVRFVEYSGVRRSRHVLWEWVDVGRLNVPRYQNNIKIAMFILFLAMYTIVVNNRTDYPSIVEWGVYVFVCGYIFEEFRLIFEGGSAFFLGSLWHWINIISYSMFIFSFALRFTGCYVVVGDDARDHYSNLSYDLLALLSIFLWVKTLSLLDGFQYFGTMIMVLQKMLKDGIMFFWLLAWVYIGFFQSFYALQEDDLKDFGSSTMLLVRGFLQDPDWELAESIDHNYGNYLFGLYLFFTSIILLNLLIALFNSSYTNITDSSEKEYLALFTFKVFSYLKSPDQFPYAAPFNLIEVFLVIPWSTVLSTESYRKLNRMVMGPLFSIPILIIARSERKRYLKLKDANEDSDIQGGRHMYRYLTVDDPDAENLFLMTTREYENDELTAGTAATIANAEEGVLATGSQDHLRSTVSPLESFEEFKARRRREKEAKSAAHKVVDNSLRASVGASGSGTGASSGQLTDSVVQSLLESLARMEAKQKEMETLLQNYIDQEK